MANHHFASLLLLLLLLMTSSSFTSARLLNDFKVTPAEPTVNDLALPTAGAVLPCHMDHVAAAGKGTPAKRLAGKYGPLVLNMLPKGGHIPPSGPSKGTNNVNN